MMISNISSTAPALNADGTISARVQEIRPLATSGAIVRLWLPIPFDAGGGFGRYYLARCVEDTHEARAADWSNYARHALYCASLPTAMPDGAGSMWELHIPGSEEEGYRWLLRRPVNAAVNLLGPFGQPFALAGHARTLFVLADTNTLPTLLPIIHTMLDQGGRVSLLIKGQPDAATHLLALIPIPVETHVVPDDSWLNGLEQPVRWADQLCAALPAHNYAPLANQLRLLRFRLDNDFAHVLVTSDLLCGVGACLTCVVSTRNGGYTRACINGPVFPLATIA